MKTGTLLLTHNEAQHILPCLHSLRDQAKIVVVDSGSTDATVKLIQSFERPVTLVKRPFVSFSDQRNYALDHCFEAGDWVLHLDADERLTELLAQELTALDTQGPEVAYNIASLTYFRGKPIPRASGYPVYQTRLSRAGQFHFIEVGHGQKAPPEMGPIPRLTHHYDHHPFDKGLSDWVLRHDRYASREAAEWLRSAGQYRGRDALTDPIARRQWLKQLSRRLPFAPALVYLYLMFAKRGVLDGPEGRDFCRMRLLYENLISLKVNELKSVGSAHKVDH